MSKSLRMPCAGRSGLNPRVCGACRNGRSERQIFCSRLDFERSAEAGGKVVVAPDNSGTENLTVLPSGKRVAGYLGRRWLQQGSSKAQAGSSPATNGTWEGASTVLRTCLPALDKVLSEGGISDSRGC